ncbi:hypothetical protein D3H65_07010 [Paraflavitalea soli]|uniref:Uncharacterized protein n=1 Tax=Paraflavitalea soli TaxID=2315862 RepID=A0A3B7MKV5_9BACT|nr:hypothetical protein [Paraflavitalea soli]AXY73740.1 hypothetical protein D3H65_07010 [Paraflavitalea soli]
MGIRQLTSVLVLLGCMGLLPSSSTAQAPPSDSIKPDYKTIFGYCLDGRVGAALPLLDWEKGKKVSAKDAQFKEAFDRRFKYGVDSSDFLASKKSAIDPLLAIFHRYWRASLLDASTKYESGFLSEVKEFLGNTVPGRKGQAIADDSVDAYFGQYIASKGLHATNGIGKTGRLYDLLVWRTEKDTTYSFAVNKDRLTVKVVFMDDFITLGWEEYATLGKLFPGGWATDEALFCVRKAYDLTSERFTISYLAHEGRHFDDYRLFPKLKSSADLEYRAKLTELSLANQSLYQLIEFFIMNANYDSENGHSVANYCAIRDLSKAVMGRAFEKDMQQWKSIPMDRINAAAYKVLEENTKALQAIGPGVEKYLKK